MKFYLALVMGLLVGCNDDSNGRNMNSEHALIKLELEQPIETLAAESPIEFSKECLDEAGMCWYKISRAGSDPLLPTFEVQQGGRVLLLQQATDISIAFNQRIDESVQNFNITLRGLPDNSTHEATQEFLYTLISDIEEAGWQHYYSPSDPRISGSQADKIDSPDDVLGSYVMSHPWLDPDHQIDLQRWLELGSFYNWYFYNDGAYLHLRAWRRDSENAPMEKATYLITLEFLTESAYWLSGFSEEEDKERWKELLPARLDEYRQQREKLEARARAAGIEIDEAYQDPPIKALAD
ncbi:hypothetical protein [Pseudomonas sp. F(2018)]|uniref:hypothetical protein n=1 Tax=Pseudomonas sp. F(2018) TaxID=2502240 RepID=UPI0010F6E66A|nr:hypothetical protein [Pseudomonas sp. F(2018)]